ncbi:flavin-containing monooxygenase [Myceligenerans pegani]|uniref:NAD(P)/FAD-dependent oxidoreductase n=1 Tax=Myceligenerans pegani TaxID=2776917 RepID=A0ABR9MXB7_9MICO|nr:NAD(P)/FAD-dependent oxidoreductase [Myceligenerans sp. TRM 65318]MBE1876018.1 NAD(P)/FAD-dependent oxidoreductase [Myceligenerans sp. TRM 65318]MBE3018289.1 NAD(P)/FAD-dependent oxidoreductase [Myceligenerans sp. TRM 65318]
MRIAVVGAGFAGLATAKVLKELGHEVTIYEKAPDVGGVWSVTRRYTGLRTQNNRDSYAFSDLPMPKEYPEWPTGTQVQAYLEQYVRTFGLKPTLRLSTEVVRAEPTPEQDGWLVTARPSGAPLRAPERFDHLVVANGIFSDPVLPRYEGYPDLVRAGGRLIASSQLNDVGSVRGKHVVVVGYGKSACDVAAEIGEVAASTTVVARHLLWKMPKKIGNVLNMKYLLLNRLGENLFRYQTQETGMERFLHGAGNPVRQGMIDSLGAFVTAQLGLKKLGLVPHGEFSDIASSTISLSTDGFYEQIAAGTITVHRDAEIARFVVGDDGQPVAELTDGATVRADVVVCGTGFHQRIPFLDDSISKRLQDEDGNFEFWHQILPHDVPNLTFAGYNSSLFSPLSAEVGALWIGAYLAGVIELPPLEERRAAVAERVRWMKERTKGKHARGTNVIPFSMHNIDETLSDIGIDVSRGTKIKQWLLPLDPGDYAPLLPRLKEKIANHVVVVDA